MWSSFENFADTIGTHYNWKMLLLNIDKLRCSSVHGYLSQGRQRIRRSNFWKGIYLEERGLYNLLKTDVTIEQEFQIYSSKINTY